MSAKDDDNGCLSKFCFFKNTKKGSEYENLELDGFMSYMHRKEPSSNPALRGDLSLVSNAKGADGRQGNKIKAEISREERVTNLHVIEDIYYSTVNRSEGGVWKSYDPSAFKPIKLNMAKGSCSQIHLVQHIASGYLGVMKVIPANREFNAKAELNVLAECTDSPFILQLIDAFSLERTSFIFLEYAPFRSLDDLTQIADGIGSEKCMLFALEILLAIQHLHGRRILHRDIKPENVFLLISGHVKLGDFSSSTYLDPKTNKARGLCCTYMTRPPEVWNYEYYSYPVDVWAFGISIYNIITNTWPIVHASQERQIAHVNRADIFFSNLFSADAADLITRAVQTKPENRWTISDLISHKYFHTLRDPFPAPYSPSELMEMYSINHTMLEELTFIQDMVARLP
ncbi:hypothetical protein RRG08_046881 [Elysia crispata]|uniref:mitogen-activated protein kinase kinase n=1 Tax=Elysia crispata TaxID=231223 RepID=A0AAE0ZIY4_9GAST|nr:hypothetical protein RRG08_046881 [Elysia crispata]